MTRMKDPSSWFSEGVSRIQDAWNVVHQDFTIILPFLDGEGLDGDVSRPLSGTTGIDDLDSG